MKKTLTILIMIMLSSKGYSQAFLGAHGNSLGIGLHAGVESGSIAFQMGYNKAVFSSEAPTLLYSTIGYIYKFSQEEPFSISFNAGGAYSQGKKVSKDYGIVTPVNKFVGMGNIEVRKQWYRGILFVNCGYVDKVYYGMGIKCFLN